MTEPLEGFEWDLANISHVLRHGVTPGEVEEAAVRPHVVMPAETIQDEKRWKLFGKTAANRRVGRRIHNSTETLPHSHRIPHERIRKEEVCRAN